MSQSYPEMMLDHERLDVYQLARHLSRASALMLKQVPPGRADMIDQYRRANLSIPLNIAEGGGEFSPPEKARFYRIAKRSATECAAVLDHMIDLGMLNENQTSEAKVLIRRIVAALIRLIQSTSRMNPDPSRVIPPDRARARKPVPVRDPSP